MQLEQYLHSRYVTNYHIHLLIYYNHYLLSIPQKHIPKNYLISACFFMKYHENQFDWYRMLFFNESFIYRFHGVTYDISSLVNIVFLYLHNYF